MESHLHVHERAALRRGQQPALEAARRRATPLQFLELVAQVDDPGVLQPPPGELPHHLGIYVPDLERFAANLYRDRPPMRVGGGVPYQRPDLIQRRIEVGLRTVARHHANYRRARQRRETPGGAPASTNPRLRPPESIAPGGEAPGSNPGGAVRSTASVVRILKVGIPGPPPADLTAIQPGPPAGRAPALARLVEPCLETCDLLARDPQPGIRLDLVRGADQRTPVLAQSGFLI